MKAAHLSMPWLLRLALASLMIFLGGVVLIVVAHNTNSWDSIPRFVWGLIISGAGLILSALFSFLCAVTNRVWRKVSAWICLSVLLLLLLLFLYSRWA